MLHPRGYAAGGVMKIPDAAFSGNPEAAYQAGNLASVSRPPAPVQQQAQPEEQLNPRQMIVREMMFGNLANDPDKLNAIHAAAVMSGVGDKITPWIESLYRAKKSGKADMAMSLISGDVDGAVDIANRMKTPFADRPTKVNPNDPNDHQWIIQFDGGAPQKIDLRNMIGATMDPKEFLKYQDARVESQGKRNVSDSAVDVNRSQVGLNNARISKVNAETRNIRTQQAGAPGGASKAPRVVKTVETNQGIVAVMSDGTQNFLKGADGKPMFGTANLKIAAGLVGKTLDPFSDNSDLAGKVTDMAGQLGGGNPPPPSRITDLPDGAKMIGTAGGKPVYEVNGKRFVAE
jgi:hypothetical protein